MTRVLVVDDEPGLRRALAINLRARDYDVDAAADGGAALARRRASHPTSSCSTSGLPDMDGTEVIRGLRGWSQAPIIVLSARAGQGDKVDALDAGADDYVTKPFGMDELLARLRAALRRAAAPRRARSSRPPSFTVDLAAKQVRRARRRGRPPHPDRVAAARGARPQRGQAASRQRQLLQEVWGPAYETETNYLRVYMAQLRRKLEPDPSHPRHLITEPGMGYRFVRE